MTILGAFASPIFLPLTAALVDALGWRATTRLEAGLAAAVFWVAVALVPGASTARHGPLPRERAGQAVRRAWGVTGFRRWVLASLIAGAAVDVVLVYQVPLMVAAGLPVGAAASLAGARGFAQLGGRVPLAPLLARAGTHRTVVLSFLASALGTLCLAGSAALAGATAFSVLAGASIGAMYTLQGIYTNELVGQEDLSLLMGAQQAIFAGGGAVGPVLAGTTVATTGSYDAIVALGAIGFLGAAGLLVASPPSPTNHPGHPETLH